VSCGSGVLVQYFAVKIMFLPTMFLKSAGEFVLWLSDISQTQKTRFSMQIKF
jgi:hypothetical protein